MPDSDAYVVVVVYDDPRGGTWRGPLETKEAAMNRRKVEAARVRGRVYMQHIGAVREGKSCI